MITDRAADRPGKTSHHPPQGRMSVQHLLVEFLVHNTLRSWETFGKNWMAGSREHDDVLLIEPLNGIVAQNLWPNRVNRGVAVGIKKANPIRQELRIDVIRSCWPRYGSGEENAIGE